MEKKFWVSLDPRGKRAITGGINGALVGTPLKYLLDRSMVGHRLRTEYRYEQRKELHNLIGRYHGRILTAADILKSPLYDFYGFSDLFDSARTAKWLEVDGQDYQGADYRYTRIVYRFLAVTTLIQRFEAESHYLDSRIAEKEDFRFLNYIKLLQKAATDIHLFDGVVQRYDVEAVIREDTIRSDVLRTISDSYWRGERFLDLNQFKTRMGRDKNLAPVLQFFANLRRKECRLRWDRLIVFHFVLVRLINAFGYDYQGTKKEDLEELLKEIENPEICDTLKAWFREYRLPFQEIECKKNA